MAGEESLRLVDLSGQPWRRAARGVYRKAWGALGSVTRLRLDPPRRWIDSFVLENNLEFLCHLTPEFLSDAVPYLLVVWDLQHRLQPFFPEVSMGEEWERREREYALRLRKAAYVVAANATGQKEVESFYHVPSARIRILPHPTPAFALEAPSGDYRGVLAKYSLEPGFVFYPAQFWPHKNHVTLLDAARLLRDRHGLTPPVVLVGSDRGNLSYVRRRAAEWGLANQVRFVGFVPQVDLVAFYRAAGLLAYPSFFGPENLPPLEAFALGCPVVAARVSGADQQLGEAALLFDPTDARALADAIRSVMTDTALREDLVRRGAQRARRFTGSHFIAGLLSILDEFEPIRVTWSSREAFRPL
jgi:glycosyltransferase involved in cell wall biosynthesis